MNSLPMPSTPLARTGHLLWKGIRWIDLFVRIHFLYFSGMLPLLGMGTVLVRPTAGQLAGVVGVALAFHVFAYVLNDVLDLPIDRQAPLRQQDPMVRGAIKPWQGLLVALSGVPVAALITWLLHGRPQAYGALAVAFLCMTAYNLWGKRCPVPPITDLTQGLAWGSLALWASWAVGDGPNLLTWTVFAYAAGFILLINGIHGGLRDLENDAARGGHTTAMFLGAFKLPGQDAQVPSGVRVFAYSVTAGLVALGLYPIIHNDLGYSPGARLASLIAVGGLDALTLALMPAALQPNRPGFNMAFRAQLFVVIFTPAVVFAAFLSTSVRLAVFAFLLASLLPMAWTYKVARWLLAHTPTRRVADRALG
jgi:4-hydroxybenzoate polyprenyltransferase